MDFTFDFDFYREALAQEVPVATPVRKIIRAKRFSPSLLDSPLNSSTGSSFSSERYSFDNLRCNDYEYVSDYVPPLRHKRKEREFEIDIEIVPPCKSFASNLDNACQFKQLDNEW